MATVGDFKDAFKRVEQMLRPHLVLCLDAQRSATVSKGVLMNDAVYEPSHMKAMF